MDLPHRFASLKPLNRTGERAKLYSSRVVAKWEAGLMMATDTEFDGDSSCTLPRLGALHIGLYN